jgi:ribosomal protein S18 acetylase RimI-like enzyme
MQIRQVITRADLQRFIELPYELYRHDANWVAPLRSEQWSQFAAKANPMLDHCEYALFLLVDGPRTLGRISAFVDRLALEHWGQPIGLFGSYECVEDREAARLLLGAARDWLKEHQMATMRGPWSFASQEWGLVVDGFAPPPVLLAPYNPPYYNQQLAEFGLQKAKDLLVYYIDTREGYRIPERYLTLTDRIQERYGITVRRVDLRRFQEEVTTIVGLANTTVAPNWGYYPVTQAEAEAMARDLKAIIDPRAVLIAEDRGGKPVGFIMAFPDMNVLLRGLDGRLLPFGWLKLAWGLPRLHQYRMWALGVVPEYQGKAVDSLLYRRVYEALAPGGVRMEINYVLEDNVRMNNALRNLGVTDLRRYRVYEMAL